MIAYYGTPAQLAYAVFVDPVVRAYRRLRGIPEAPIPPGCRHCGHDWLEHQTGGHWCVTFRPSAHDPHAVGRYQYERRLYERDMARLGRTPAR